MSKIFEVIRGNLVICLLVVLLGVETTSVFTRSSFGGVVSDSQTRGEQKILRISDIDGPRISDEAVMTVASAMPVLPGKLWIFLLLAYGALLVFNFSYTFEKVITPQWGWEATYTLFVLWGWFILDTEQRYLWFPFMTLKVGLIVFALYVLLLEKRGSVVQQKLFEE